MLMNFNCNVCNKSYKSYQSLWNHNKIYHNNITKNETIITQHKCKYCDKKYSTRQNKWKHEQKCKNTIQQNDEIKKIELELKVKQTEKDILKLKLKLSKSDKIENVTLRQLNKRLIERNNLIKNSVVNSNNTNIQNNITNNFNLVGFGKEEIIEILTKQEKMMIMNAKFSSLEKLIETIHCGKYNQFKNIILTNMKDNYMYKYDDKQGKFILSTKADILNSLIDYRLGDLEIIYNDLLEKNKLDEKTKECIEKFINKINYESDKYTDYDGKEHENYKQYKINEVKMLLFNNQDKITDDISLLLTTDEVN